MIPAARYDKAIAQVYEIAEGWNGYGMGVAITIAASDYQIPRGHLVRRLQERKIERELARRDEAAGMWWNQ